MTWFVDRADAGRQLAARLAPYRGSDAVVLALPRGGVPVAAAIAAALEAPLDLVLVRKIGVPGQPELAMGALAGGRDPIIFRNEDIIRLAGISQAEFDAVKRAELGEINRRRQLYLGDRPEADLAGRTAILVDDGVATGATAIAALRAVRQRRPASLVLAAPVLAVEAIRLLEGEADTIVYLTAPTTLNGIGSFYSDFGQVSDEEVVSILARFPFKAPSGQGPHLSHRPN
jgi:putative phosphoribosyl transferase